MLHPSQCRNRAIKVNSFYTTDTDILSEFERQTGGEKWQVKYTSLDQLKELEKSAWEKGSNLATLITLRRIWMEGGTLYDQMDNELIGEKNNMSSLADAVAMAIHKQQSGSQVMERQLT